MRWVRGIAVGLAGACTPSVSIEMDCRGLTPYVNDREFNCDVCKEEQGCTREGDSWICPASADRSCTYHSACGGACDRSCCAGECVTCVDCVEASRVCQ
jgi:hypothetical protein